MLFVRGNFDNFQESFYFFSYNLFSLDNFQLVGGSWEICLPAWFVFSSSYFYFPEIKRGTWWGIFQAHFNFFFFLLILSLFSFSFLFLGQEREGCHKLFTSLQLNQSCVLIKGNYQVEVEALLIQGPKVATVMNQVRKLEVTALVLGQRRPSTLLSCLCATNIEDFAEQCIDNAECRAIIGVKRKQTEGISGTSSPLKGRKISGSWHNIV